MRLLKIIFTFLISLSYQWSFGQTNDDLLGLLISKGYINQKEVDSIRKEAAQKKTSKDNGKIFILDLQIKNRLEYRDGYGNIPESNSVPAVFVNQRSRLNFIYQEDRKINAVLSIQDARVWGSKDPRALNGTIQLFEGYIEPYITPNFSIRIGRQRIAYDNQRLFTEYEWRVNAGAHDAVNFRYNSTKLNSELVAAFNQTSERFFGTDFSPTDLTTTAQNSTPSTWTNYKALAIHYLKYSLSDHTALTSIIASDAIQDVINKEKNYWRFTYGGRFEHTTPRWYYTASAYQQSGRNNNGKTIKAWYIQPEIKYTTSNLLSFRAGAEILSGDKGAIGVIDHSFVPLYGVAHRFNGFMDFFTKFPVDVHYSGLVNPYFFVSKTIGKKIEISSNNHLFYTQRTFLSPTNGALKKFMGYEHDLQISYKPNSYTAIEGGYSVALPTNTLTAIKKTGNSNQIANWAYIQVKFTPTLFKTTFK